MRNTKHRVQFDFSDDALKRLDSLAEQIDVSTRAEVLRHALRVYWWLVQRAKQREDLQLSADELQVITGIQS